MSLDSRFMPWMVAALLCLPALAAAPAAPRTDLDEVTVNGERVRIDEMRQQIVQLEDRFYDRYNALNTRDEFDVHCIKEARTGTRLIKRSCRPAYQDQALAEEAQAGWKIMQRMRETGQLDGSPPVPASVTIERRLPEYKKNMEELTRKDPELARLLKQRGQLIDRFNAAQKATTPWRQVD